jgi:hypothetical protein
MITKLTKNNKLYTKKINEIIDNLGSGGGDADTVDGYHAGNDEGEVAVNNGTLNTNLDADKLDGYHAGNTSGSIPINNGTVNTNLNADMLDGYHITDINAINNDLSLATYSKYYVVSSLNASPAHGELNYRTSDNKLFKYNAVTQTWTEIDWVNAVKATPEWINQKLRTTNGYLEIANGSTGWYQCYPVIGTSEIQDSTNYKYFLLPSAMAVYKNKSNINIVYNYNTGIHLDITLISGVGTDSKEVLLYVLQNESITMYSACTYFYDPSTYIGYNMTIHNGIYLGNIYATARNLFASTRLSIYPVAGSYNIFATSMSKYVATASPYNYSYISLICQGAIANTYYYISALKNDSGTAKTAEYMAIRRIG